MLLEICANSLTSALNAQEGGADRIELCHDLTVGGVTPDTDTLKAVRDQVSIPAFVLIRSRAGDFVYNQEEMETMLKEIELVKELGYQGVVVGALTPQGIIDEDKTLSMMRAAGYMDLTFHKAFDEVQDHLEALDGLRDLGVQRILTSAGAPTAIEGFNLLSELIEEADDEVIIMPGGGIRPSNIAQLRTLEALEYHSAAMGPDDEYVNVELVRQLKEKLS